MSSGNEGQTPMIEISQTELPTEPIIVHQGRYRLYRKPDGGLHLVYQRDDSDTPDHMELPGQLLKLAQLAGEGKLSLPQLLQEVMKLRNAM